MPSDEAQYLSFALKQANRSSAFIGSLFAGWQRAFGVSPADVFETTQSAVVSLGLCLRPRDDAWQTDVHAIAQSCRLDEGKLATFLRQAVAVERLSAAPPVAEVLDGRLLAARDRNSDSDPN